MRKSCPCRIGESVLLPVALIVGLSATASAQQLFSEDFNDFFADEQNFNGAQFESGHPVAFGGGIPDWEKVGGGAVHAVDHANRFLFEGQDYAPMIWHDNVLTLDSTVVGSNNTGQSYTVDFRASPAVYQAGVQQTSADDGLLIEVLRGDDSVLATHTHMPGAWAGNILLNPGSFQYVGDGTGDVRFRIGPSNPGSGRFGGAIDSLRLVAGSEIFSENFNQFTAPPGNFNGNQFESGLPVAFGGDIANWSKAGGGAVHAVVLGDIRTNNPSDFAVMIWQDNVITQFQFAPIADSNTAGQNYRVDFLASPAVYQAGVQQTSAEDGILIEVLRADNSVLASYTHLPGAWAGDIALSRGNFRFVGDGSGDVRFRIGPSNPGSGRFGGAIDNLMLSLAAPGLSGDFNGDNAVNAADYVVWRKFLGAADESALNGNGDGMNGVDPGDYQLWRTNFGASSGVGLLSTANGVPEPATILLIAAPAFACFLMYRKTSSRFAGHN